MKELTNGSRDSKAENAVMYYFSSGSEYSGNIRKLLKSFPAVKVAPDP